MIHWDRGVGKERDLSDTHSPPQRLRTSDRVSGQRAWREAPFEIERVARVSAR